MALTKGAKIGIGVGVGVIVILAIIAVLVWHFLTNPGSFPNGFHSGKVKYGDSVVLFNTSNQLFFPAANMIFGTSDPQSALVVQIVNAKDKIQKTFGDPVAINDKVQFLLPSNPQVTQLALGYDSSSQTIQALPKTATQTYFRIGSASSGQHLSYNASDVTFEPVGAYGNTVGDCGLTDHASADVYCGSAVITDTSNWSLQRPQ
jgi:hypothetical protein